MDARVLAVIEKCQRFMDTQQDAWSLPPESARFVHATVLAAQSRRCLEIGTSYGHSGLWIASAAAQNGGSFDTVDLEARKSKIAADYYREAGLDAITTCHTGPAAEVLDSLKGPFDFVLNDADKVNYIRYIESLYPKLAPGAVVLSDNVHNEAIVREQFVPWVRAHPGFFSTLVPVGNGIEMSVKKPA